MRAMLHTQNLPEVQTHAKTIRSVNSNLGAHLPHPLNVVANRTKGEQYEPILPSYPAATSVDLLLNFVEDRSVAQGMLLRYMKGTADWEAEQTKQQMLSERSFPYKDFRTKDARELRDKRLQDVVKFLHCAFRYRGKANYRDAIFLLYGQQEFRSDTTFIRDLAESARFASLCALAYAERKLGRNLIRNYLAGVGA